MKNYLLFLWLCIASISVFAQAPEAFNYQAVARDNSGNPLVSRSIKVKIGILSGSISGTTVYAETHTVTTNQFGLFNLAMGSGTVVSGTFASINWGSNSFFTKVEIDPNAGNSFQLLGTSQLLSVPYALYAKNAGSISGGSGNNGFTVKFNNVPVTDTSINDIFLGSITHSIDLLTEKNYRYNLSLNINNNLGEEIYNLYTTDTTTFANTYTKSAYTFLSGTLFSPSYIDDFRYPFPSKEVFYCPSNMTPTTVTQSIIYYWDLDNRWQEEYTLGKTYYQVYKNNPSVTGFNLTFPVNVTIERQ